VELKSAPHTKQSTVWGGRLQTATGRYTRRHGEVETTKTVWLHIRAPLLLAILATSWVFVRLLALSWSTFEVSHDLEMIHDSLRSHAPDLGDTIATTSYARRLLEPMAGAQAQMGLVLVLAAGILTSIYLRDRAVPLGVRAAVAICYLSALLLAFGRSP